MPTRSSPCRDGQRSSPPICSADPEDDYLVSLAAATRAVIVSGDAHVTDMRDRIPVRQPAKFHAEIEAEGGGQKVT